MEIIVSDTGVGIPEDIVQKLFKEYSTHDNIKVLNPHGVGLGLVCSKKLVNELGPKNEIKVVSQMN